MSQIQEAIQPQETALDGLTTLHTAEESRPGAAKNSEDVAATPPTIHSMSSPESDCLKLASGSPMFDAQNGGQPSVSDDRSRIEVTTCGRQGRTPPAKTPSYDDFIADMEDAGLVSRCGCPPFSHGH